MTRNQFYIILLFFIISAGIILWLHESATINVQVTDITTTFKVNTNLNNVWTQETRPDTPQKIKYIAYGIHTGIKGKYKDFRFWKYSTVEPGSALNFTADMRIYEDAMVEVMGYSKHVNLGDEYNTLDYYLVITGNRRD